MFTALSLVNPLLATKGHRFLWTQGTSKPSEGAY
jgi:hypothetical protein